MKKLNKNLAASKYRIQTHLINANGVSKSSNDELRKLDRALAFIITSLYFIFKLLLMWLIII